MRIRIVQQTKPKIYKSIGHDIEIPNEQIPNEISWEQIEAEATALLERYTDAPLSSWGCNDVLGYKKDSKQFFIQHSLDHHGPYGVVLTP